MKDWKVVAKTGIGTAECIECEGYKIYCNGDQWIVEKPNGTQVRRNWKSIATAQRNAEKMMEKK